ncbi:hypothetical protein [Orenia marismortui]|uniref:hypothetical protein n=1 Tax=Orenia marismortui TaxID=46469 RepID=UPI000361E737|nr:hypothetical protein [Orenia marismortui]
MAKRFSKDERLIVEKFAPESRFNFKGEEYEVVFSDKPTCSSGEPKTDIYVACKNLSDQSHQEFKITFKKGNADFLENKLRPERAEQLLGENWIELVRNSVIKLKNKFLSKKLIYITRAWPTRAGSITLGWRFELFNKKQGLLSAKMDLTRKQVIDVYAGTNLSLDKKNAMVADQVIENSGVANYIIEYNPSQSDTLEKIVAQMIPIEEYVEQNQEIYFGCKALNYRTFKDKYEGNRSLAVYVKWNIVDNKLKPELVFEEPLLKDGHYIAAKTKAALAQLEIETTDDITEDNVVSMEFVYND